MKSKYGKLVIIILIVITIISVGYVIMKNKNEKLNDISEIKSNVGDLNVEFRSERGFGNDRFDIYSFSIKDFDKEQDFKLHDKEFEEIYTNDFKNIINIESDTENQVKKIELDIEKIREDKGLRYKYINLNGTKKLYLYSKSLNKGYCLILTI